MFNFSVLRQFTRFTLFPATKLQINTRAISTMPALQFKVTDQLWAEPMKKKKKVDPQIIKAREDRRRKRIEKQIRRLEKNARQLKPIDELEVPLDLIDQIEKRKRPSPQLTADEIEARALLQKEWTKYKRNEYMANVAQLDRIMAAQQRALDKLYEVSEDLYDEAVMVAEKDAELEQFLTRLLSETVDTELEYPDLELIPYTIKGPVATPPIKNYESPDGEYIDLTKKWDN